MMLLTHVFMEEKHFVFLCWGGSQDLFIEESGHDGPGDKATGLLPEEGQKQKHLPHLGLK